MAKIISAETRAKISAALTGGTRATKGKTWDQIYGPEYAEVKRGVVRALMKGRTVSEITRSRTSKTISEQFHNGRIVVFKGKHHTDLTKALLAKSRRKQFCVRGHDTHVVGRNGNFCCRKCAAMDGDVTNSRRRAAKRGARIGDKSAIKAIYDRARELRKWFNVCVDHIIPLVKGGAHSPENLQIIYSSENVRKHAKLNYIPSVIFI